MASAYDIWKTTDPEWDAPDINLEETQCAHRSKGEYWYMLPDGSSGHRSWVPCNVYYYEHDDEAIGHEFEMPEREDY